MPYMDPMGMYSTRLKTITPSRACGMAGCSKLRSISTSDLTKSDGAGTLSLQTCLAQGRKFAAKNFGSQNFRSKWIEMTRNDVCIPILAMQLDYWAFTANIHKCSQKSKNRIKSAHFEENFRTELCLQMCSSRVRRLRHL